MDMLPAWGISEKITFLYGDLVNFRIIKQPCSGNTGLTACFISEPQSHPRHQFADPLGTFEGETSCGMAGANLIQAIADNQTRVQFIHVLQHLGSLSADVGVDRRKIKPPT